MVMSPVHQVCPKHLARHSERRKKTRQTEEEVGRQHEGMDRPGVRQVPEGSGEQEKMEKTGCKIICGAPTTLAVKGLMMMIMMMMMMMMMMILPIVELLHLYVSFSEEKTSDDPIIFASIGGSIGATVVIVMAFTMHCYFRYALSSFFNFFFISVPLYVFLCL